MRRERQIELLERVAGAGHRLEGLQADACVTNEAAAYTDPARFAEEMRVLFREGPVFVGFSTELANPGDHRALRIDGVPVVVVRQADGGLRALVNMCRHRGASLVEPVGDGKALAAFSCPYHAWTYELDGRLRARPAAAGAFDDVVDDCAMRPLSVGEAYGLIFVQVDGSPGDAETVDVDAVNVDEVLAGMQDDLGAFGLGDYVPIASRTNTWKMNWKLFFDTFTESYHIRTLHRDSIAPMFNSDTVISERYGRNVLAVGLRRNVHEEFDKPRDQWSLLPYGTIQYLLAPNAIIVHQLDHVEVWRAEPLDVGTTICTTTVFAPQPPRSEGQRGYFEKNLDLLVGVTDSEDFPLMEQIHANLASGAMPEVVYGRNEPPLILFHQAIDEALTSSRTGTE